MSPTSAEAKKLSDIVRWLSGALLLLCLALPLSRCERSLSPGDSVETPPTAGRQVDEHVFYPSDFMDFKDWTGYVVVVSYTWPLAAAALRLSRRSKRLSPAISIVELLLSAGSIYVIYSLSGLGRRMIGAYLGLAAAGLYFAAALAECRAVLRERRRGDRGD